MRDIRATAANCGALFSSTSLQTELVSAISLLESKATTYGEEDENNEEDDDGNCTMTDDVGMKNLHAAIDILLGTSRRGRDFDTDTPSSSSSSSSATPNKKTKKQLDRKQKLKLAFAESFWDAMRKKTNKINSARRKEQDIFSQLSHDTNRTESYTDSGALFKLILSTSPSPLKQRKEDPSSAPNNDPESIGNILRSVGLFSRLEHRLSGGGGGSFVGSKRRIAKEALIRERDDPFRDTLESVVRRVVEDKVRAAIRRKDSNLNDDGDEIEEEIDEEDEEEHRRILPLTLQWCEQILMPWLALLLLGQLGINKAITLLRNQEQQQQKQHGKDEKKEDHQPSSSPVNPSPPLPLSPPPPSSSQSSHSNYHHHHHHPHHYSTINQIPHTQFSLTSCIAPELDDGSGGAVGVEDARVSEGGGGYLIDANAYIDARFVNDISVLLGMSFDPTNASNHSDHDDEDIDLFQGLMLLRSCDRTAYIHAHESVARAHSEEAFNLLRDWPSSKPALIDLRESMAVAGVSSRGRFVSSIVHSFKTRLLHAGVATASVLDVCLLAVRSLRVVDVSGVMLALIVDPLQAFLRSRSDTIRCIVSSLTEDTGSELYKELEAGRGGGEGGSGGGRRRPWEESGAGGADDSDEEGCDAEDVPEIDAEDLQMVAEGGRSSIGGGGEGGNGKEVDEDNEVNNSSKMEEVEEEGSAPLNSTTRRRLLCHLRKIFRPSVRQRIPTNPFTRGEAMFRSKNTYSVFSEANDAAAARVLLSRPRGMWYPAPSAIDATRDGILRGTHNSGDLLTLLVNIYGSRELFVTEYSRVLSQRLLSKPYNDYVLDQEERTVELLKVRFGEAAMVKCEAMMKDVVESKRISHAIRGLAEKKSSTSGATTTTAGASTTTVSSGASAASEESVSSNVVSSNIVTPNVAVELFPTTAIRNTADTEMNEVNDQGLLRPSLPPLPPKTSVDAIETDCVIVSGKFWPSWQSPKTLPSSVSSSTGTEKQQKPLPPITNQPENALLAESLRNVFDSYATRFADVRKPRELILSPHMGEVTAEIEFPASAAKGAERKSVTVTGTPQQVSALLILADEGENGIFIPVSLMASKLRLTLNATLRLLSHWTNTSNILSLYQHKKKGTLVYVTSCLPTTSQLPPDSRTQTEGMGQSGAGLPLKSSPTQDETMREAGEDGRSTSPAGGVASFISGDLNEELLQGDDEQGRGNNDSEAESVWTSYIMGMLTNLGKLPLDRIHNTLGLFASMGDYPYRKSQQETGRFLGELARAGKIDVNDGMYSMR